MINVQLPAKKAIAVPRREVEALFEGALLKTLGGAARCHALRKSKLVAKKVHLPKCGYTMYYHEREAVAVADDDDCNIMTDKKNQPTILFFHGISQRSQDLAGFIASLDIPPHIRVLAPEQMGHGRDIERARLDRDNYVQPTHESMLETTSEYLDVVKVGNNTHAFGISLGGAVCYYVANKRPDIIKKTTLVSPAILPCIDKDLIAGIQDGSNNFFCFESRDDVKLLFRDLSTGRNDHDRKKKDPLPKSLYEPIYRSQKKAAPEGHYKAMLLSLIKNAGLARSTGTSEYSPTDNINMGGINTNSIDPFAAVTDIDRESHRLVIWPEKDMIINFEQGKQFFDVSLSGDGFTSKSKHTDFETIPDCGHVFCADGKGVMDIIRPRVRDYLLNFTPPKSEADVGHSLEVNLSNTVLNQ